MLQAGYNLVISMLVVDKLVGCKQACYNLVTSLLQSCLFGYSKHKYITVEYIDASYLHVCQDSR